jgi:hypothetical protein
MVIIFAPPSTSTEPTPLVQRRQEGDQGYASSGDIGYYNKSSIYLKN